MRSIRVVFVLLLAVATAGCFASTTLIKVKPDGSGTVEQTLTVGAEAMAALTQLAASFGEKGQAGQGKPSGLFGEEELRSAASKLGEGVRFLSSEPIKTADAEGVKAIYAFADITKLRVNQRPDVEMPGSKSGGGTDREDVAFRFARRPGGPSTVTVVFPEMEISPEKQKARQGAPTDASQLAMARELLKGLRISIAMEVDGRILKTNSSFVDGSTVTLLELDFSRLLENPAAFEALQGASSVEEVKSRLRDMKGLKINAAREVVVEFAGR